MTISGKILATTMNSWMKFWKSWWTRYAAPRKMIRIGGEDFPKEVVKKQAAEAGLRSYRVRYQQPAGEHDKGSEYPCLPLDLPLQCTYHYQQLLHRTCQSRYVRKWVTVFSYSNEGGEPVLSGPPLITHQQMNGTVSRTRTVRVHFILDAGPFVCHPARSRRKERPCEETIRLYFCRLEWSGIY